MTIVRPYEKVLLSCVRDNVRKVVVGLGGRVDVVLAKGVAGNRMGASRRPSYGLVNDPGYPLA